jgi:hypothetical protein
MRKLVKLYAMLMLWSNKICIKHLMSKETHIMQFNKSGCYACLRLKNEKHEPTEREVKKHLRKVQRISYLKDLYTKNK